MKDTHKEERPLNWKWGLLMSLIQSGLLLLFVGITNNGLFAQAFVPATGSGSSSYPIIETAVAAGLYEGPDITDPCSCTDIMDDCFEDEFVILSPTQDIWMFQDAMLGGNNYGTPYQLDGVTSIAAGTVIPETGRIYLSSGIVQYYVYSLEVLVCDAAMDHLYAPLGPPVDLPTAATATALNVGIINSDFDPTSNDCGRSYGVRVQNATGAELFTGSLCHEEKKPVVTYAVDNPATGSPDIPATALVPPPAAPVCLTIDIDGNIVFDIDPNAINGINNGTWEILLNGNTVVSGDFYTLGPYPLQDIDLMALSNATCGLIGNNKQNLVFRYDAGDTRPFKFEDYDGDGSVTAADLGHANALEPLERSILNPGCAIFECPLELDIQWCPNGVPVVIPDLGDIMSGVIADPISSNTQYPDDQIQRLTVCPDDPNKEIIRMIFPTPDFDISQGDVLTIYDGTDCSSSPTRWTNNGALIAGANGLPNGGWIDASCSNATGCLTFEFRPNSGQNKGSYRFTWEKRPRTDVITCPSNAVITSVCDLNNSNLIAGLYTIPAPTTSCAYVPMLRNVQITNVNTGMVFTPNDHKTLLTELVNEGDFLDDGDNVYEVGETLFLEMGTYTVTYEYMEVNGSFTMCSHTVELTEVPPVCNNQVNISLDGDNCNIPIAPDMLIEGDGCAANYTINIIDGPDKGTDTLTYASLGQLVSVQATSVSGNSCWGYILVEDKAAPHFTCPTQYLFCGLSTNPEENPSLYPQDGTDCSLPITYTFTDAETAFGCSRLSTNLDPDTVGMIVRTWYATDAVGIRSRGCVQNMYLLKPKLTFTNVMWPEDTTLYCNINPSTLPDNSGYPSVNLGDTSVALSSTCYFGIDYDDIVFDTDCEGVQKIQRTWRILDWCHAGTGSTVLIDLDPQIIKVLDTIAPIILDFPTTLQYQSNHGECAANVVLPNISILDACSPTTSTYRIIGPSSTLYGQGGVMENIPFGANEFTYIAEDGCGNQRRQSITLNIADATPPTAIAGQISVSLIDETDLTWVYATAFDGGSHDNCSIVSILARRVGEVDFGEALGFTCSDIGTHMIEIQVTDEDGNVGLAMNEITVTDKLGVCACNMTTGLTITETSGATQNDGKLCAGDMATLTASANVSVTYAWSTGEATAAIQASSAAIYTVTITDGTNCSVVETATIEVNPAITSNLIATENSGNLNDDAICSSESADLTFTASGGTLPYTYQWSGLSGLTPGNMTTVSPTSTTTYSVTITDAEGCTSIASRTITVSSLAGSLTGQDVICGGNSATLALAVTGGVAPYTYVPSDASLTLEAGETQMISPTSTTTYTIIVTDAAGCSINLSKTINVNTIVPNLVTDDALICMGASTTLNAVPTGGTTPYSYTLEEVGGATIGSGTNIINISEMISPIDTTSYQLQVTDAMGCVGTQTITINVPTPSISITVENAIICAGEMVELTVTGSAGTYIWRDGETTSTIRVLVDETTDNNYFVQVTDATGCTARASIELTPTIVPALNVGMINTICSGTDLILTPTELVYEYRWSLDSNKTFMDANPLELIGDLAPDVTTKYYVTITNSANSCTRLDSVTVEIHPSLEIIVPITTLDVGEENDLTATVTGGTTPVNYSYLWSSNSVAIISGTEENQTVTVEPSTNGFQDFKLKVTDENTGCMDSLIFQLNAQDAPPPPMSTLSGEILTEQGQQVEQTTINLSGYEMLPAITGAAGHYEFTEIPRSGNYTVTPEKDSNPLNGVSTFDLVLLSKHILGITILDSPYKLIAADINRSGSITAYDMVQLRKLILNIDTEFPNNTSWRFVDAAYEFTDPANPFGEAIPETYEITDLDTDMNWLDFIAVKIGDLNDSAVPNSVAPTYSRNRQGTLLLNTQQELSEDGETLIYHFGSTQLSSILGYQFTLEFDPTLLAFDRVIETDWVSAEHFGTRYSEQGMLTSSWNTAAPINFSKEEKLFSLAFKIRGQAVTDQLLQVNSNKIQAEAYQASGELLDIQLHQEIVPEVATEQLELYQNRPNPFTGKTTIGFSLPTATTATMRIFNTEGSVIKVYRGTYERGYNELIIDSQDLTHYGALYYQLATPTQIATRKMIYAK